MLARRKNIQNGSLGTAAAMLGNTPSPVQSNDTSILHDKGAARN